MGGLQNLVMAVIAALMASDFLGPSRIRIRLSLVSRVSARPTASGDGVIVKVKWTQSVLLERMGTTRSVLKAWTDKGNTHACSSANSSPMVRPPGQGR
jgi:hypothetical protein